MYVKTHAAAIVGIDAVLVAVEVNMTEAGAGLSIVGLPDNSVKESIERITTAFAALEIKMPIKKIVVNLAPADLRKEGSAFDLPTALAVLASAGQIPEKELKETMILGELSLDGSVRAIKGALPLASAAQQNGFKRIIVPAENAEEAAVVQGIEVYGVESLKQIIEWFRDEEREATKSVKQVHHNTAKAKEREQQQQQRESYRDDFADVKGQEAVKRAFEIAAAGGHNIIMIGPPGSGKTMLSKRLPTILPPMTMNEALETTKIYSVAGKLGVQKGLMNDRPFRAPHHITSQVAIIGGGTNPQPGEVSLANNGILFLDELPEFGRAVLEVMRQPLEEKSITIARARYTVEYPANFTLVASMNPCPCGYYNHPTKECSCSPGAVNRYLSKISGPLMDRIDLHIEVAPLSVTQMNDPSTTAETSSEIRQRVIAAREIQRQRFKGITRENAKGGGGGISANNTAEVTTNAMMTSPMIRDFCPLDEPAKKMLEMAMTTMQLSARAYDRIIKVARTIADLAQSTNIEAMHIAEAIGYRSLDRDNWGR